MPRVIVNNRDRGVRVLNGNGQLGADQPADVAFNCFVGSPYRDPITGEWRCTNADGTIPVILGQPTVADPRYRRWMPGWPGWYGSPGPQPLPITPAAPAPTKTTPAASDDLIFGVKPKYLLFAGLAIAGLWFANTQMGKETK